MESINFGTVIIILVASLGYLIVAYLINYFHLIKRTGKTTSNLNEKPIRIYILLAINVLGILVLFLPWIKIPFGSFNALELLKYSKMMPGNAHFVIASITYALIANYIVFIITSIHQINLKATVSSNTIRYIETINPSLIALIFILLISNIPFPLGIAPYFIIILAIAQIVVALVIKEDAYPEIIKIIADKITVQGRKYENEVKQDFDPTQDKIKQLQRLKQLFDDGILTQEEFNNEKSKILDL